MAVAMTRTDLSARQLRVVAAKAKYAKAARRMLAIALVLERVDRKTVAETCVMDRQTLRGEEDRKTLRWTGFSRRTGTATTRTGWRGCLAAARPDRCRG